MAVTQLIKDATAINAAPPSFEVRNPGLRTFHAVEVGTGTVTATVIIEVSNNDANWLTLGTITLSATTTAQDGFSSAAPWSFVRARVSAITGTGATINVFMGS